MLKASIRSEALKCALGYISSTATKDKNDPGLECVQITVITNPADCLMLETTNKIESSSVKIICNITTDINHAAGFPPISFYRLNTIVQTYPDSIVIELTYDGTNLMIGKLQSKPIKLTPMIQNPFTTFRQIVEKPVIMDRTTMDTAIRGALPIIETLSSNPIYNCLDVEFDGTNIEFIALKHTGQKGYNLKETVSVINPNKKLFIQYRMLKDSMKMFLAYDTLTLMDNPNIIQIAGTDPNSSLQEARNGSGDVIEPIYQQRLLAGNLKSFNNIKSMFDILPNDKAILSRNDLNNLMIQIGALCDNQQYKNAPIKIKVANDTMTFSFSSIYGTIKEELLLVNKVLTPFSGTILHTDFSELVRSARTDNVCIADNPSLSGKSFIVKEDTPVGYEMYVLINAQAPSKKQSSPPIQEPTLEKVPIADIVPEIPPVIPTSPIVTTVVDNMISVIKPPIIESTEDIGDLGDLLN